MASSLSYPLRKTHESRGASCGCSCDLLALLLPFSLPALKKLTAEPTVRVWACDCTGERDIRVRLPPQQRCRTRARQLPRL